jgi:dethiobiotin synthetase
MKQYFITGTDTGIGKTYVTAQLAQNWIKQGEEVCVLKPVATGCIYSSAKSTPHLGRLISEDALTYERLLPPSSAVYEGWTFEPPISPHLAARQVNCPLTAQEIAHWCQTKWTKHTGVCLIEGAGGLMVPLNEEETWLEVIRLLQVPVIFVVGIKLGCLNHALLTASVLQTYGIQV